MSSSQEIIQLSLIVIPFCLLSKVESYNDWIKFVLK